jgi:hypothetical protein
MYKIEDNVPFNAGKKGAMEKYPFSKMNVGQSFLITDPVEANLAASAMGYHNKKKNGKRFSTRKVDGGRRFWRIE